MIIHAFPLVFVSSKNVLVTINQKMTLLPPAIPQRLELAFEMQFKSIRAYGDEVTEIQDGSLDQIFESILNQEPVIVILGVEHLPYGDFGTHSVVVIGFEGNHIIFIEPAFGKKMRMDMLEFLKAWQSRGKKAIIIHN